MALKNVGEVRRFLRELCEPWGGIRTLDVIPDAHGDLVCFVELTVAENKTRFYSLIHGAAHGDRFVFRIPRRGEEGHRPDQPSGAPRAEK